MPRITPISLLFLPTIALCASLLWAVSKLEGPFTLNIIVPHGVQVRLDHNQPHSASSPPPLQQSHPKHPDITSTDESLKLTKAEKSIHEAINSFNNYEPSARSIIDRKHARFDAAPSAHKKIADKLGFTRHFETAKQRVSVNADFAKHVAEYASGFYNLPRHATGEVDYELVDLAFGHLARDWSVEGAHEREQIFKPILDALQAELPNAKGKRVLLPGAGLGRLAHEIADRGYTVEANELDYGSILTYRYLLNHTHSPLQHTVYPFSTQWTHQLNPTARFRPIRIPDVIPKANVKLIEGNFLEEFPQDEKYDAVVSLFFIDVGKNIVDFLENIHRVLKPGGIWINLGPLKWAAFSQLQLSAEEVLELATMIGFDVDHGSRKSIDSVYAHQPECLLKFTYVTQFWEARKRRNS